MSQELQQDEDIETWYRYPQHRDWFNKLYIAEKFSYQCGPAGIPVPETNKYIVRPIMNLAGMSANARVLTLDENEVTKKVPPGFFWCEMFSGRQLSVDWIREDGEWKQLCAYQGFNTENDLTRFSKWKKVHDLVPIPRQMIDLKNDKDVTQINFECIKNTKTGNVNIFEVHLRNGFDHMIQYDEIVPVFKGDPQRRTGYRYIKGFADGWGQLLYPRIGYLVKPISSSEKRSK